MTHYLYTQLDVNTEHCQLLERFTIFLFDKTSDLEHVDEARKELFRRKAKSNGKKLNHAVLLKYNIWYISKWNSCIL